jgi:hypothetical protein
VIEYKGGAETAYITRRRCVLAAVQAGAKLAAGEQQRQIVGADEGLRHVGDRTMQGSLPVVVSSLLGDIAYTEV